MFLVGEMTAFSLDLGEHLIRLLSCPHSQKTVTRQTVCIGFLMSLCVVINLGLAYSHC